MAQRAWEGQVINVRERPLSSDVNQVQSLMQRTLRDLLLTLFAGRLSFASGSSGGKAGFISDGLKVGAGTGMQIVVSPGLGFQIAATQADVVQAVGGIIGVDDLSTYKPVFAPTAIPITLDPAPGVGQERYDIVEVRYDRRLENPISRNVFDPGTGAFLSGLVNKTLSAAIDSAGRVVYPAVSTAALSYKVGSPAATGTAVPPPATSGYMQLAQVYVGGTDVAAANNKIVDKRQLIFPFGMGRIALEVAMAATGTPAPSMTRLVAPPGIVVAATRGSSPAIGFAPITVFVMAGAGPASMVPTANVQGQNNTTSFTGVNNRGVGFGSINGTLQTQLADATKTSPAVAVAVGQPYLSFDVWTIEATAGAVGATGLGTVTYEIQIDFTP